MTEQIVTRREAKERGLTMYFPGSRCKHGHIAARETRSGECSACRDLRLANRDRSAEYAAKRTPEFRAKARAEMKEWREKNRERIREYHREYGRVYRSNPDVRRRLSAKQRERMHNNPVLMERARANARQWGKEHPIERADRQTRVKVRKWGAFVEDVPRLEVFERDGWTCQICKSQLSKDDRVPNPKAATVDHIMPLCKGGKHERSNVQTACYRCNVKKSRHVVNNDMERAG